MPAFETPVSVPPTPANEPFHAGERALQERLGVAERMLDVGRRVIRPFMPDQHREFFAQLPFVLVGSVDALGGPGRRCWWASPASCARPTHAHGDRRASGAGRPA